MGILHHVLAAAYPALRLGRAVCKPIGLARRSRLRVLLFHDVAPGEQGRFARQLRWLSQRWAFVSPERFVAMMEGSEPIQGDNLLLTFDDGFASNRVIAENVLKPMGIQALFFVVSDFVSIEDHRQACNFIARNIFPNMSVEHYPEHWGSMSWADLEALLEQGHTIGAHTATHARLSQVVQSAELENEIVSSADLLERRLGVRVEHFAFTFGNLASFSPASLAAARRRFRYIYTGMRGNNARGVPSWALRRDAASPADSLPLVGALLEGGADIRYKSELLQYEQWSAQADS